MTHLAATTEFAGKLITAVTGIDRETDTENFELCLNFAVKNFQSSTHQRTNKFDVKDHLDGLEEKFHVLNNDILAERLRDLLNELDGIRFELKPELLSLILQLSDNPLPEANRILLQLGDIANAAEAAAEIAASRELSWKEINNGIHDNDEDGKGLWDIVNFAADSSDSDWDEEEGAVFAKITKAKTAKRNQDVPLEEDVDEVIIIDDYIEGVNREEVEVLQKSQFWTRQQPIQHGEIDISTTHSLSKTTVQDVWILSESQVIREVIFMLYGLPCSLYDIHERDELVVNTQYSLRHASPGTFRSVLDWFGKSGTKVRRLRSFTTNDYWTKSIKKKEASNISQAIAARRTFVSEIEKKLAAWQREVLVPIEEEFILSGESVQNPTIVSLIGVQRKLEPTLKPFLLLFEIVEILPFDDEYSMPEEPAIKASKHLELLFDCASELQALGDIASFEFITSILFPCIATYLRPIIRWMETGELRDADGEGAFFVEQKRSPDGLSDTSTQAEAWLRTLWHDRYFLKRGRNNAVLAPSFIQNEAGRIFVTGKSVLFLRKLRGQDLPVLSTKNVSLSNTIGLSYETVCGETNSVGSLSAFSDLFAAALSNWVSSIHTTVTAELRDVLYYECGVWESLEALSDIYFMRDGHAMTSFCTAFFDKIDKGRENWDDRFLLTELIQSVYVDNTNIDISRITLRNTRGTTSRTAAIIHATRRSVKMLHQISVDYRFSWPIMNIIKDGAIVIYRKIWSLLLMIRRAKAVLEKIRLRLEDANEVGTVPSLFAVRWRLLAFVNLIHAYLTDLVLWPETEAMKVQLAQAVDVDGMIKVHETYIAKLQELCLLGEKFAPLYQALISILDLAIAFAKDHASTIGDKSSFDTSNRSIRNISGIIRPKYRRRRGSESDDESNSDDEHAEDEGRNDEENNGDVKSASGGEDENGSDDLEEEERSSNKGIHRMSRHAHQFDRLVTFLTAGLKSIARAGVYPEMIDILAERMEMGAVVGGMRLQEFGSD